MIEEIGRKTFAVAGSEEVHRVAIEQLGDAETLVGIVLLTAHKLEDGGLRLGMGIQGCALVQFAAPEVAAHFLEILADQVIPQLSLSADVTSVPHIQSAR